MTPVIWHLFGVQLRHHLSLVQMRFVSLKVRKFHCGLIVYRTTNLENTNNWKRKKHPHLGSSAHRFHLPSCFVRPSVHTCHRLNMIYFACPEWRSHPFPWEDSLNSFCHSGAQGQTIHGILQHIACWAHTGFRKYDFANGSIGFCAECSLIYMFETRVQDFTQPHFSCSTGGHRETQVNLALKSDTFWWALVTINPTDFAIRQCMRVLYQQICRQMGLVAIQLQTILFSGACLVWRFLHVAPACMLHAIANSSLHLCRSVTTSASFCSKLIMYCHYLNVK